MDSNHTDHQRLLLALYLNDFRHILMFLSICCGKPMQASSNWSIGKSLRDAYVQQWIQQWTSNDCSLLLCQIFLFLKCFFGPSYSSSFTLYHAASKRHALVILQPSWSSAAWLAGVTATWPPPACLSYTVWPPHLLPMKASIQCYYCKLLGKT